MISKILQILGLQPRISNFFLTVGQNNFGNKIPNHLTNCGAISGGIDTAGDETTMLTVTGSSISWVLVCDIFAARFELRLLLLFLLSSSIISTPSSEVLQELVLTSEYSEGTALIGRGGFLGEELSGKLKNNN